MTYGATNVQRKVLKEVTLRHTSMPRNEAVNLYPWDNGPDDPSRGAAFVSWGGAASAQ